MTRRRVVRLPAEPWETPRPVEPAPEVEPRHLAVQFRCERFRCLLRPAVCVERQTSSARWSRASFLPCRKCAQGRQVRAALERTDTAPHSYQAEPEAMPR